MDSDQEAILVLRAIGSIKQKPIYLRDYRAHLMAEAVSYELDNEQVRLCYFCLPLGRCCFQSCLSVCLHEERPHVTTHRPVETCFGILVTSLGFKARVGSLIHVLHVPGFTSGATLVNLLTASMAAEWFSSIYL